MAEARRVRETQFGLTVTYSPKVFIPLTQLCRDRCGYCTFAKAPARLRSPYMSLEEVVAIARAGARAGCHEALFTLGERPEERYPAAAEWLASQGYASTVEYLARACQSVLEQTGLLPHSNAGALSEEELSQLRAVTASQGMMVESLRVDLSAHARCPDKVPSRRLATLEAAGRLDIPFTTGILVGIGETRQDRIEALEAIAQSHLRHGHVQEVIVQNFLPKAGTAMAKATPASHEEHLEAIALARLILPPEVHVQAPPNLSDDLVDLLDAGIDDWGGISPITADHVNPERPWPALERLARACRSRGLELSPRLPIYPGFANEPERWLHKDLRPRVLDRSDASGYARDDPGSLLPERTVAVAGAGDGAEVRLVGPQSSQWSVGSPLSPPQLLPHPGPLSRPRGRLAEVLLGVTMGQEPGLAELEELLCARGTQVLAVAEVADELRRQAVGDVVTWVANRNINYTNICTFKCRFCGFSKGPRSLNLRGTPYLLSLEEIARRALEAARLGATEVCLQGGIHPDFDGEYYLAVTRAIKEAVPSIHVHAFSALEVSEGARRLGAPLEEYLTRLKEAGLRSLPGTAAEVLDDEIRRILCPDKLSSERWLEVHEAAHRIGLRSNVTMMFGSIEAPRHWARHMVVTRELQKRTGGFTEFVGLPFVHMASPIYLQGRARRGPTWREVVLVHAVARIAYRGLIDNVQASWVKLGRSGVRQLLAAGVNDLGGTLMDENISRAAGAAHGQAMTAGDFEELVAPLGRRLVQRNTLYGPVQLAGAPA